MTYERLTAADTVFLRIETPHEPQHVGSLSVLDGSPLRDADGRIRFEELRDHAALDGFRSGVLIVLVDSSSAMYRIKLLVDGGLEEKMRERFYGAKFRIRLRPGQFYRVDSEGRPRYEF